jgi:hypothetical protein
MPIAVIETTHRSATMLGYRLAPIVVALNPSFRLAGGDPHRKFTVCQYQEGLIDMRILISELNDLELGWGGSPTIIGSAQGKNSELTIEQVVKAVVNRLA